MKEIFEIIVYAVIGITNLLIFIVLLCSILGKRTQGMPKFKDAPLPPQKKVYSSEIPVNPPTEEVFF